MEFICGFFGFPTTEAEHIVNITNGTTYPSVERQFTTFEERMDLQDFSAEMESDMKLPFFILKSEQDKLPSYCNRISYNTFLTPVNQPQEVDNKILRERGILSLQNETCVRNDQQDPRQQAERFDLTPLDQRRSTPVEINEARSTDLVSEQSCFDISESFNSPGMKRCKFLKEIDFEILESNIWSDYFVFETVKSRCTLAKQNTRKRKQPTDVTGNTSQTEELSFFPTPRAKTNYGDSKHNSETLMINPNADDTDKNGTKVQHKAFLPLCRSKKVCSNYY